MARIGVISDTHNRLDPRVRGLFEGVEHILHAGDIGEGWVVEELAKVAPVTAVVGNTDGGLPYGETEVVQVGGRCFLVRHIVDPGRLTVGLRERLMVSRVEVVVFGHTHRRYCERVEGRLFVNPGSAGRSGLGVKRSVAVLDTGGGEVDVRFFEMDDVPIGGARRAGWPGCR